MNEELNYITAETVYVLDKIRGLIKITPERDLLRYRIKNFFGKKKSQKRITSAKEDEILYNLQKWGDIRIKDAEPLKDENEKVYYLEVLPKFYKSGLEEQQRNQSLEENVRKDRETQESLRIQRIGASGKHPLIYTMDAIIGQCLINKGEDKIFINFRSLGFADNIDDFHLAHYFFIKLKNNGCFKDVERISQHGFSVIEPDIEKLKEYKLTLEQNFDSREYAKPLYKSDSINYFDDSLRRECEKKWEIIKFLFSNYISQDEPEHLDIPMRKFFIGIIKELFDIETYLNLFERKGCYEGYKKINFVFHFNRIDKVKLIQTHDEIKKEYEKFSEAYKINHKDAIFDAYKKILRESTENPKIMGITDGVTKRVQKQFKQNCLKSIYLITERLEESPPTIFLVLDEYFEMPIRCAIKNKMGEPTYIKKLYNIAYFVDAPDKKVNYNKNIANNINNGLFRKRSVEKYMKTNKFKKPTLVQKSENGTLVLKNEIPVKTGLIKNDVPLQHQSLYLDKTR